MRPGPGSSHPPSTDVPFDTTYRREIHAMVALATSLTGSRETGFDLAQEAMVRAYRNWPEVSTMDRPGAWIRRVLINLTIDHHRRGARERRAVTMLRPPVEEHPEARDATFWDAVRSLPERQRAAVALRYIDDMSVHDIAEVLDVSAGTVKSVLHRARQSLEGQLQVKETTDGTH